MDTYRPLIIVGVLLLLCHSALALGNNWAADAVSSITGDGTGETEGGVPGDAFDEDTGTKYSWETVGELGGTAESTLWVQSEFGSAQDINYVQVKFYVSATGLGGASETGTYAISAYYGGQWNTIESGNRNFPGSTTKTYKNLALHDVTKIKVELEASADAAEGYYPSAYVYCYEVYAYEFSEMLRIWDGASDIIIGGTAPDDYKLRIRKSSKTFGIPLIDTADGNATKVRMYDGSSVKALRNNQDD